MDWGIFFLNGEMYAELTHQLSGSSELLHGASDCWYLVAGDAESGRDLLGRSAGTLLLHPLGSSIQPYPNYRTLGNFYRTNYYYLDLIEIGWARC